MSGDGSARNRVRTLVHHSIGHNEPDSARGWAFVFSINNLINCEGYGDMLRDMWKVGPHEWFDHMGTSLRRLTFDVRGHFLGSGASPGGGILITPNCVRFRPIADIHGNKLDTCFISRVDTRKGLI